MDNIGKIARKILDSLPFNGDKLKLSAWFTLISLIPQMIPGVNLIEIIQAILANPTKSGVFAVLVAAIHKVLKAKFPAPKVR